MCAILLRWGLLTSVFFVSPCPWAPNTRMGRSSSGPDGCCSWLCCRAAETASFILWNEGSWGRCQHGCCGRGSLGPQGTGYLPTGKQQHFSQLRRLSQCVWDQPHPCPEDQAGYACNRWRGSHVVGVGDGDGPGEPHPASRKQPGDGQDGQFLSRETTKFRRFYEKISDFKTWEANSCFCFVLFCFVFPYTCGPNVCNWGLAPSPTWSHIYSILHGASIFPSSV